MGVEQLDPSQPKPTLDVWIVSMGDTVTREDFEKCSSAVDPDMVPKTSYLKGEVAWRYIIGSLLPQFTMRQKHIPRTDWQFAKTKVVETSGKPYIKLKKYPPTISGSKSRAAMGFSWAETGSAIAYAFSFGQKEVVTNIGVGIHLSTPSGSTEAEVASHLHFLTREEEQAINIRDERRRLNRLYIIVTLKDAYLKAIGQPVGFDHSRISYNNEAGRITVDGETLSGWDFSFFEAHLDRAKKPNLNPNQTNYLVCVAVFRGHHTCRFQFPDGRELNFLSFIDTSQVIRDVDRLGEYDGGKSGAMPSVDKIPLSAKSSFQSDASNSTLKNVAHAASVQDSYQTPPKQRAYTPTRMSGTTVGNAADQKTSPPKAYHHSHSQSQTQYTPSHPSQYPQPQPQHTQPRPTQYPQSQTQQYSPERVKGRLETSPHTHSRSHSHQPVMVPIHSKGDRIVPTAMYPSFR